MGGFLFRSCCRSSKLPSIVNLVRFVLGSLVIPVSSENFAAVMSPLVTVMSKGPFSKQKQPTPDFTTYDVMPVEAQRVLLPSKSPWKSAGSISHARIPIEHAKQANTVAILMLAGIHSSLAAAL